MYTVVVCSNCQFVWIVQDHPTSTRCRRCQTQSQFDELKQYYRSDDLKPAKRVRARVQATVDDQDERFDRASESGVLDEPDESTTPTTTKTETPADNPHNQVVDSTALNSSRSESVESSQGLKQLIADLESSFETGVPVEAIIDGIESPDFDHQTIRTKLERLKEQGEIYEPTQNRLKTL